MEQVATWLQASVACASNAVELMQLGRVQCGRRCNKLIARVSQAGHLLQINHEHSSCITSHKREHSQLRVVRMDKTTNSS